MELHVFPWTKLSVFVLWTSVAGLFSVYEASYEMKESVLWTVV